MNHSVIVITFMLAQSDSIKRRALYDVVPRYKRAINSPDLIKRPLAGKLASKNILNLVPLSFHTFTVKLKTTSE